MVISKHCSPRKCAASEKPHTLYKCVHICVHESKTLKKATESAGNYVPAALAIKKWHADCQTHSKRDMFGQN